MHQSSVSTSTADTEIAAVIMTSAATEIPAGIVPTAIPTDQGGHDNTRASYVQTARHTPGPWKWDGHALVPETRDPDQHAVHTILEIDHFSWGFVGSDRKACLVENDANCILIAAAPELLKAARLVYEEMTAKGEISAITWEVLVAAIDKATGAA
jgi:hypothetical protein